MLISFNVGNHRSIRDEQAFSMEASERNPDERVRSEGDKPILTVAAIYGANASGKSNVLGALRFMCDAVLESHRAYEPKGGVPRDAFAWGRQSSEPSTFEIEFRVEDIRYQYGFVADDERFREEWLFAWPSSRKQVWFERDEGSSKFSANNG